MSQNQKRQKTYELFAFSFLEFDIGVNRFSIKFCNKLENPVKIFLNILCIDAKLENVGTIMFLQVYKLLPNFDSNLLIFDLTLFPGNNSPNIAKSNRVFPGKVRGDRALILTCLNSPIADVFPHYWLYFLISAIFRGKRMVKVGPKVQTLGTSLFHECFCFAGVLPLVKMSAILDHI